MKQKHTTKQKANRGPSKTMTDPVRRMSIVDRRRYGIKAVDSEKYDEKHGIATL